MNVYISVDMEGVAGVATPDQTSRGGRGYPGAQELMTGEANAAIAGAFEGGADSVTVSDSHGTMDNLLHEQLDPRAHLVFGTPRSGSMTHGLTPDFDVALFVGYHAPAGERGILSHSFSSLFVAYRLNGRTISEAEVNALYAAHRGVPVGLVTGDDVICALAEERLPGTVTVPVKQAEAWTAARSMHPEAARVAVREGAARAVSSVETLEHVSIPDRLVLEAQLQLAQAAEVAALVPGTTRVDAFTIRRELADPAEIVGLTAVWYELAAAALSRRIALLNR